MFVPERVSGGKELGVNAEVFENPSGREFLVNTISFKISPQSVMMDILNLKNSNKIPMVWRIHSLHTFSFSCIRLI